MASQLFRANSLGQQTLLSILFILQGFSVVVDGLSSSKQKPLAQVPMHVRMILQGKDPGHRLPRLCRETQGSRRS